MVSKWWPGILIVIWMICIVAGMCIENLRLIEVGMIIAGLLAALFPNGKSE